MKAHFTRLLRELEAAHDIRILFACESGSRGWEFPSPDSDFDLRFLFLRPQSEYLRVTDPADTISLPINDELDVYGWDLRKALRLLLKSNVTPFEWLQSPIIYHALPGFREAFWALCQEYFNPRSNAFHYLGIARGAMECMAGNHIGIKKLFYILRPLLAASWCLSRNEIAPMRFSSLKAMLPDNLRSEVDALVTQKATMPESEQICVSDAMLGYIQTAFDTLQERAATLKPCSFSTAPLNTFLLQSFNAYDHPRA